MTPERYRCPRGTLALPLTGKLEDPAWDAADWSQDFVDIEGDIKPTPTWRTRVKVLWDDNYFYIGAQLEEPHVWATLTEHDSVIFQDNDFEVFIDPDGDANRYFEFEINALNTTWDLYLERPYRDGGSADNSYETDALSAVHVQGSLNDPSDVDQGWSVEIAFPWACFAEKGGMPCPPRPGDTWRINFSRVQWDIEVQNGRYIKIPNHQEHNWVWTPQGVIDMHHPEQWGFVTFEV